MWYLQIHNVMLVHGWLTFFTFLSGKSDLGEIKVSPSCPRDTQNYENWVSNFLNECKKERERLSGKQYQDVVACLENLKVSDTMPRYCIFCVIVVRYSEGLLVQRVVIPNIT